MGVTATLPGLSEWTLILCAMMGQNPLPPKHQTGAKHALLNIGGLHMMSSKR